MRMLVVGASGYLGKPLYAAALRLGATLGTSRTNTAFLPLSFEAPDTFDYGAVTQADMVLVTAGIAAPDICSRDPARAWKVNVTGTATVISRLLVQGARVIFFSSDTVYGEREEECNESTSCNPLGDYALMKYEVENRFAGSSAFKTIRLSLVFSYEDKFTSYLRWCTERQEVAELYHPFYRSLIHRDDVVEGTIALARRWNEFPQKAINFGGPDVITRVQLASTLRATALSGLRYRSVDPGADFFKSRPRTIRMKSPILASLLGRAPRSLREAVPLEFNRNGKNGHA